MKKTKARKITDMVEKNTHAALRKRFPDLYDFLYACNDEQNIITKSSKYPPRRYEGRKGNK